MKLRSVIGLLLLVALSGLALPVCAQETEGLQPFTKDTHFMSLEGFARWQNLAKGPVYQRDTQYMSAIGYARWQNYLRAKSWVGLMKAAVLAKGIRDEQKKIAMEKLAVMRFLGTMETFPPKERPDE